MLKFVERRSSADMLQFIVNLLYLGMKSGDCLWAEANGTREAIFDLLFTVPDDFVQLANDILLNGSIEIDVNRCILGEHRKISQDIEEYQDIIDILRCTGDIGNFSKKCECLFKKLTKTFSVHENFHMSA